MSRGLLSLNEHLFNQLDRLAVEDQSPEALQQEIDRAKAIVAVSDQVVANAKLQLDAAKVFAVHGRSVLPHLPQIGKDKE